MSWRKVESNHSHQNMPNPTRRCWVWESEDIHGRKCHSSHNRRQRRRQCLVQTETDAQQQDSQLQPKAPNGKAPFRTVVEILYCATLSTVNSAPRSVRPSVTPVRSWQLEIQGEVFEVRSAHSSFALVNSLDD